MKDGSAPDRQEKWYYTNLTLVLAFSLVGPLAIPLIWINPKRTLIWKLVLTLVMLLVSVALWIVVRKSLQSILDYYQLLDDLMKGTPK